jgi:hypothetical protein
MKSDSSPQAPKGQEPQKPVRSLEIRQLEEEIPEWLSPGPMGGKYEEVRKKRIPNTGKWFLELDEYNKWAGAADELSFLICHGKRKLPA